MKIRHVLAVATVLAVLGLAACGDTTLHEPGVYKGPSDPEAGEEAANARAEKLRERAILAHSDR
ncbi:hypothetical protein [Alkalisalibacterium limincola]|uniref:Lipoprotein n=1 Tax=Alkalisalibacterium limincola TaxID=2699169 RepID=A0A5C8KS39_9GAMM|nr:hypothetical protein [Alkalisalibacterium limincola]TXK62360.1 hypothetical protein FU658_09030 [Alkalisalibacterium limincola]